MTCQTVFRAVIGGPGEIPPFPYHPNHHCERMNKESESPSADGSRDAHYEITLLSLTTEKRFCCKLRCDMQIIAPSRVTTCHTLKEVKQNAINNLTPFFGSVYSALLDGMLHFAPCVAFCYLPGR